MKFICSEHGVHLVLPLVLARLYLLSGVQCVIVVFTKHIHLLSGVQCVTVLFTVILTYSLVCSV